ncbi:MAG: mechanosensitive ion channel domain-containing protein [Planctomycetota bacterium]
MIRTFFLAPLAPTPVALLQAGSDADPAGDDPSPLDAAKTADDPLTAGENLWAEFRQGLWEALPWVGTGAAIFLAFWLLAIGLRRAVRRLADARGVDPSLTRLLGKGVYLALLITGAVVGLETAGVDMTAAVAGLGLTGFALGFALKDIVSNLIAGVLIILYKPFDEGDRVKCGGFEGVVRRIDLRYTFMEHEGDDIFLPNSKLFTDPIVVKGGTSSVDMRPEKAEIA